MDLNEPQSSSGFLDFIAWLQANRKRLILGGSIVALILLVSVAYIMHAAQKETAASKALSDVPVPSNPTAPLPPGTGEAYLKVADDFGGTSGGSRALLLAAATYFDGKNFDKAQVQYDRFLREYAESPWAAQAFYGRAASLDALGRTNDAMTRYDEIIKRFAGDPVGEQSKLSLGRLNEKQNKLAEALKYYGEVFTNNYNSYIGSEAGLYREELYEKHPELRPPPPAPPAPPTPQFTMQTNRPAMGTNRPPFTMATNLLRRATNAVNSALTNAAAIIPVNKPAAATQPEAPAPAAPKQ